MRLIDADKARESATVDLIVHHLDRQPTVDAVEVVRCKDCEHFEVLVLEDNCPYCTWHYSVCAYNDFCSYGERR